MEQTYRNQTLDAKIVCDMFRVLIAKIRIERYAAVGTLMKEEFYITSV